MTSDAVRRVMIVTGSSGEIGSHLVRHFAAEGWTIVAVDKRPAPAAHPAGVVAVACDLTSGSETAAALDGVAAAHGAADVLVNCAGLIANAPLVRRGAGGWELHDFSLWSDVIASSLTSAFHATAVTVRHVLEARKTAVVINISSICASGNPGQAAYSAAKAGLDGFTLAIAKELAPLGIRAVGLAPGYFKTASTVQHVSEARLAKIASAVPLKRLGTVDEIADAIAFIIRNQYVNGSILELDGGLVI